MSFLYPSNPPAYKSKGGEPAQPAKPAGLLSWLWCLFGIGAGPTYRTRNGGGTTSPTVPRGGWTPAPPQYKAAPECEAPIDACAEELGEGLADDCPCDETGELPREIHVYPAE